MLWIAVKNEKQNKRFDHRDGPIEFGRGPQGTVPRYVIDDAYVSRDQLRIEELPGNRVRVRNLSNKHPVRFGDGVLLQPTGNRELDLPVRITVGETSIAITATAEESVPPATSPLGLIPRDAIPSKAPTRVDLTAPAELMSPTIMASDGYLSIKPVHHTDTMKGIIPALPVLGEAPSPATLTLWMETVLALQRSSSGPAEVYNQTAEAMVRMIGLDVGLVLLRADKGWRIVARAARVEDAGPHMGGREFSHTVLRQVEEEKQTFFQDLGRMRNQESLRSVDAVVVSPIFGLDEAVIGALYGLRRPGPQLASCKVQPLEAQLVQLLAAAVGANLAGTAATRTRTQFEQFFSPELVRKLERDPGLLEGRAHEVTIFMSDLRGFSALSERLGPQETCRLIRDVMERLSARIVEHGGVIVSYLGDGILAMWNAPTQQPDHAPSACRAALAMLAEMPELNAAWQPIIGAPLNVGIGINTGPAQVGNTGSSRKFMYGPLGNTVNLASRVEGATKQLRVPVLLTGSTRALLGDEFVTRRLCQVRVAGIQGAVDLYELHGTSAAPEWLAQRDVYETALTLFESRQWLKTCQQLLPLLEQRQCTDEYDQPTLKLMKRSWACLEAPPEPFDPVMELVSK